MCGIKPKQDGPALFSGVFSTTAEDQRKGREYAAQLEGWLHDAQQHAADSAEKLFTTNQKLDAANKHIASLQRTIERGREANYQQSLKIKELRGDGEALGRAQELVRDLKADRKRLLGQIANGVAASETAQIKELQHSNESLIHEVLALRQQLSILAAVAVDLAVLQGAPVTYVSDAFDPSYVPHG